MSNVKKLKPHDRQTIAQNLMTALKKRYKSAIPKHSFTLLESLIFAALLEDVSEAEAKEAYDRLTKSFYDLNEIRVSSITEIEEVLSPHPNAGWPALRIREILQYTFEKYYRFDLEELKRKPVDQVEKQISKFKHITPFMKLFLIQNCLGAHAVPLDDKSRDLLAYLGVIEPQATTDEAAEDLKHVVRKADTAQFCHLVRCLACDPKYKGKLRLTPNQALGEGPDATTVLQRVTEVLSGNMPKTPGGPSAKAKAEAEEAAKPAAKKGATATPKTTKSPATKTAPASKAAPAKAPPAAAKPAAGKTLVATVKKPVEKKSATVRSGAAKTSKVVTKKVSKPQATAKKASARKK